MTFLVKPLLSLGKEGEWCEGADQRLCADGKDMRVLLTAQLH